MSRHTRRRKQPASEPGADRISKCPNCGNPGPHFVMRSMGQRGFFICVARIAKKDAK